jgi:predicted nucleic acid-binding protein
MFPDNTVLINFALINRMDLLARLARGYGGWCATVASECGESARRPELSALTGAAEIFGAPLFPDDDELKQTRLLRYQLAAPGDPDTKHLGEAETVAIVAKRQLNCYFVTDDEEARRLATLHCIPVADTWRLLKLACRKGWIDADTFWGYVLTLATNHRKIPYELKTRESFNKWLAN